MRPDDPNPRLIRAVAERIFRADAVDRVERVAEGVATFVYRIERATVLVQDSVELNFRPPMAADERWITSARIAGLPVLSDQGDRVGHLLDLDLDGDTLGVKSYVLDKRRWLLLRRRIQQADVVSVSNEMMIVRG